MASVSYISVMGKEKREEGIVRVEEWSCGDASCKDRRKGGKKEGGQGW